jgi:WD repeat and SOF domain-containing protein 1
VITGSDDGNVRIWKAKASDKLGIVTARERAAMEYRESLKERWKVDTEINRVMRYIFFLNSVGFFLFFAYN